MPSPITELESNSTAPKWVSEHLVSLSPRGGRNCRQSSSYQHQAQRGEELAQPVSERGGPPEAALGGWASPSEALSSGHVTGSCSGHNQPLQMNAIKVSRPAVRGPREGPGAGGAPPTPAPRRPLTLTVVVGVAPLLGHGGAGCCLRSRRARPAGAPFMPGPLNPSWPY